VTKDAELHAAKLIAARETAAARRAAEARVASAAKSGNPARRPKNEVSDTAIERNCIVPSGATTGPRRLGLADLRAAALARRIGGIR
jgi:hypothetical protein